MGNSRTLVCSAQWVVVATLWFGLMTGVGGLRCFAQSAGVAQLSGSILDPSGSPIPGAEVKITQVETKYSRVIISDTQGRYVASALPVGPYQLEVTAGGFKTYSQSGIVLQVGDQSEVNVSVQIGAASERVEVTAQASMVETSTNEISQVVDARRISELPLNGRLLTQLVLISGAATYTPNGGFNSSRSQYGTISISVAGGQGNSLNYLLDGGDHNDLYMNVNLPLPFPDALQEFSFQTSGLSAQYGLHPSGVINAVTKSGTNSWHGDLFEFLRNGDVNARNFFAPAHDSLKRNQFGGTFGGRVIRDKLFFFAGFQGTFNRSNPPSSVSFVPTAAALNGDFSVIDGPGCVSGGRTIQLTNPTTGLPFVNNQIPTKLISPVALNLAKFLPAAQSPCGKVTYGIVTNGDEDMGIIRMDWLQSAKNSIVGRYFVDDYRQPPYFDGKNILEDATPGFLERSQSLMLSDTYSFSATLLNSFHATFTRRRNDRAPASTIPTPATLGASAPSPAPNAITFLISNYFNAGSTSSVPAFNNVNSFHWDDDVSVVRGKHQMGFGVTLGRTQGNNLTDQGVNGVYTFNGQYATGKSVGDALAAFLLGAMSDFTQSQPVANATRQTIVGLYAQDTIKLTSRLTVNLGLRWDPAIVPYDLHNEAASFSMANFDAGIRSTIYTNAPPGLLYPGDPGMPRGLQYSSYNRFSPRLGIVWDPTGRGNQTIRVSGAILRDTQESFYTNRVAADAPFGTLIDLPFPFLGGGTLANAWGGYAGGAPFPLPSPVPSNFVFPQQGIYVVMPLHGKTPYTAQWNVSYQRELAHNWLATATYIGSKTTNLWVGNDINPPVYIPGSSASPNARRVLYLQNPTYGIGYSSIIQNDPNGNSNYNALLLSIQHRFSHGFTWLSNYTRSHCLSDVDHTLHLSNSEYMNPNNRAQDYGNCNFDVRDLMNTSLIVISPKGRGLAGRIFGQWQLSPIVSIQTGLPVNVITGTDVSQTIAGDSNSSTGNLERPNLVPGCNPYLSTPNPLAFLNRACFVNGAPGTFGDLGRNVLYGPGAVHFDVALSRTFSITERWQLTPRVEAFNIINHPNFPAPSLALNSSTFGMITGANASNQATTIPTSVGDPRIFQFALKLVF